MSDRPKPCPFCGGSGFVTSSGKLYWHGQCIRCGAESSSQVTEEKARKAWDTRYSGPLTDPGASDAKAHSSETP